MTEKQDSLPEHCPEHWKTVGKTRSITRRFEFENYAATRGFLDQLAALSEETGLYPDLGFAKTYVNVTLPADDEAGNTTLRDGFACRSNDIFEGQPT